MVKKIHESDRKNSALEKNRGELIRMTLGPQKRE